MITRKVQLISGAYCIVLPKQFCDQLGIEKGSVMSAACKTNEKEIAFKLIEEK